MIPVGLACMAVVFILLAIPALARTESAVRDGNRFRAVREGGRAVLAIAAGSILILLAVRAR